MKSLIFIIILVFCTACQYFKRNAPATANYYQNRWDQAVLLLKENDLEAAEPLLKEIYFSAQTAEPELATRSLFELGQISEKKGQWTQALVQFKECESKKSYLPGFKAELELPARLAGLYATLGELKVSEIYAKKVESNLQVYMMQISLVQQKKWWAETYFRMGSFPVGFLNADNWKDFAKRFHSTSQYLIRSMELSDPVWSERSLELVRNFFKKSFELLAVTPHDLEENSVLSGALIRDRINILEEILKKMQLYRPLDLNNSRTAWLLYQSVDDYEKEIKNRLYAIKDSAPLSKESEKRNAIEREGILVNPSSGGIDKNPNDPNL